MATATPPPAPAPVTKSSRPAHAGWRTFSATVLVVLATLLLLPAISIFWFGGQVLNTTAYVDNVSPAISDPAVKKYIATEATDFLVEQINQRVNVPGLVSSIGAATLEPQVEKLLSLPQVKEIWVSANESAHATLINSLKNRRGETVTLELTSILTILQEQLVAQDIPVVSEALSKGVLPADNQLNLKFIDANTERVAADAYEIADTLDWALPLLVLALLVIAFAVSWRRRGTLLAISLVMITSGGFLLVALTSGVERAAAQVNDREQADAAKALVKVMTEDLRTYSLIVLIGGIALAIVAIAWFLLPNRTKSKTTA